MEYFLFVLASWEALPLIPPITGLPSKNSVFCKTAVLNSRKLLLAGLGLKHGFYFYRYESFLGVYLNVTFAFCMLVTTVC